MKYISKQYENNNDEMNVYVFTYLKTKYNARTMGYPDFQMKRFDRTEGYRYYDEIGLGMNIVKSEVFPIFSSKGLPMHM